MSSFFQTTKKGESVEWKADLNSTDKDKQKNGVKQVIAAMTVGKDVSFLFMDVVKCMQTQNIELKKLVYLYIINNARSQPDKAISVVNGFQKDADHSSPLVRALAIRTMGCIRVERITEHLCDPLRKALKDRDPYVRKTAAVCVAKLYDINSEMVEDQGFLDMLRALLSDGNSMVVANAVAALSEISEASGKDCFNMDSTVLGKLLAAINECTEWGQIFILDCLARYEPSEREALDFIERVIPRLKHVNSAVVMSAVRVIMKCLKVVKDDKVRRSVLIEKLPPPLITLLSDQKPEIQFVALRNINLIVQKYPQILANHVQTFFCKYNDPIYVKMEKLAIMIQLVSEKNLGKVLLELKEYAREVDVEFVRKAIRAIGRCAIKLDAAADKCITVLMGLAETKIDYVCQEVMVVIKDIFRKYPKGYERSIIKLCKCLKRLDEPDAEASLVWMIGEYSRQIQNAGALLDHFISGFNEKTGQVQLQILTAAIKLFLMKPKTGQERVEKVLNLATKNVDNPDLRDRGYVYWRMLHKSAEVARHIVLAEKPPISDDTFQLDDTLLDTLLEQISTLASIYHKPPETFVRGAKGVRLRKRRGRDDDSDSETDSSDSDSSDSSEDDGDRKERKQRSQRPRESNRQQTSDEVEDILGLGSSAAPTKKSTSGSTSGEVDVMDLFTTDTGAKKEKKEGKKPSGDAFDDDFFGGGSSTSESNNRSSPLSPPMAKVFSNESMELHAAFKSSNGQLKLRLQAKNVGSGPLTFQAMKMNKNYAGLKPAGKGYIAMSLAETGDSGTAEIDIEVGVEQQLQRDKFEKRDNIQIAVKPRNLNKVVFFVPLPIHLVFDADGKLGQKEFLQQWGEVSSDDELQNSFSVSNSSVSAIKKTLAAINCFVVAAVDGKNNSKVIYACAKCTGVSLLFELNVSSSDIRLSVRAEDSILAELAQASIAEVLKSQ